ncbi:MAG: sigma-70 family RNA polymerase sigma factor [Lachnospiraceae bacterium]|jgi:RNA polymerase sigma factor (sigma-70 family)|nr:sigma-70 family RNA polymerase sigma factor [Lachnospiraceae bacterium]MDD3614784.1 sigma-70 family RNA polymerase sigma factor [Lachnospiraceae bacterium]
MSEDKFNSIYEEYSRLVLKIAFDVVQDWDLAQDVCQEVFVKLYQKGTTIQGDDVKPWLIVCAKNRAIDYLRNKERKHSAPRDLSSGVGDDTKISADIMDEICYKELRMQVFEALEKKNEKWHELMVRTILYQEELKKIAQDMNKTENSLKIQISRAKKWIRENFMDDYDNT